MKKALIITLSVILIIGLILLAIYINHRIQSGKEESLLSPLGTLVEVNGHQISVYTEGDGEKTLVFMSGGGTCSPILDFKSLYSLLSDDYRIVVIEKLGYGFSDVADVPRDIDSVLNDTRSALQKAGIEGPFVLCPHSMSGIEALYWAQTYPDEVSAIIGLDMAVPAAYETYNINMFVIRLGQFAARLGITRLLPGIAESDAIRYGTLTDKEKELYRALFFNRTATTTMINEVQCIKDSAAIVGSQSAPQLPMIMFVSNGSGTGWDTDTWVQYQRDFAASVNGAELIELSCAHYVHDYEYISMSAEIKAFLESI